MIHIMRLNFSQHLSPRLQRLLDLPLFSTLDRRELQIVDNLLHERSYVAGEVIFDEGEQGQAIYCVFSGSVLICRQGDPAQGIINELGPGHFFGDLALLDDAPRAAQARAVTDCTLGVFFRSDFQELLDTDVRLTSKLSLQLARQLGERLRAMVTGQRGEHCL